MELIAAIIISLLGGGALATIAVAWIRDRRDGKRDGAAEAWKVADKYKSELEHQRVEHDQQVAEVREAYEAEIAKLTDQWGRERARLVSKVEHLTEEVGRLQNLIIELLATRG